MIKNKKVLIIEPDVVLADILAETFEARGFTVFSAHTGMDAKNVIQKVHFDVVILEILVPTYTGYDLMRLLSPNTACIVYTNLGNACDLDHASALGAHACLIKAQTSITQLLQEVESILM